MIPSLFPEPYEPRPLKIHVTAGWDIDSGLIGLAVDGPMGAISREILHTKERVVRQALIKLGWTPPPGPETDPASNNAPDTPDPDLPPP